MSNATQNPIEPYLRAIGEALRRQDKVESTSLMERLMTGQALRDHMEALTASPARLAHLAATAQLHPNSFTKYIVMDIPDAKLVLHIWSQPENPTDIETHNHRWNFVSTVLSGSLHATSLVARDGDSSMEYLYSSPSGQEQFTLERVGPCRLEVTATARLDAGTTYFQDYREIHRAQVLDESTVTVIIQGPIMQQSTRVFLQANQKRANITRNVRRPSTEQANSDLARARRLISAIQE